ncbi:hypothetical protein PRZ48_005259 [Zasmidium cellare]|uniref:SprT-like domain-containing protein n=1 Tax=Zasmidium cellare TaxID=395010 RepID=A0ABR0ETE9_ZASCE|nr:hypothetical protein PRZ48_005259 [Zasmidium cellare]
MSASNVDRYDLSPQRKDLVLNSHRPIELVEWVKWHTMNFGLDDPTVQQGHLTRLLQDFVAFVVVERHCPYESLRKLELIRDAVSKVVFCGALDGVSLEWGRIGGNRPDYGVTEGYGADVKIGIRPFPKAKSKEASAKEVVQTLLHELCHAMLMKYSCVNRLCGDQACMGKRELEEGKKGHGVAWRSLASFVESITEHVFGKELLLDIKFD